MRSFKIAQICPKYYPSIGGVESHVQAISERLAQSGFDVQVLTTDRGGDLPKREKVNSVMVERFKSYAPGEAYWFSRELKSYLAENSGNFDIVHAHSYHAFPALYAAKAKSKNKLIFTPHYHGAGHTFTRRMLHYPYAYLAKSIFEKSDRVICVSRYEKNLIQKKYRVADDKIVIIPNGINLKEFENRKKGKTDKQFILFVGRLEKYKGVDYLIRTLPYLDSDITLEIIGTGPFKRDLQKLTVKLGLQSRVDFYQNLSREELIRKYTNASLFAMLSSHEAFCISLAEALACKTPSIVANTSALSEWIDNKNCFGVDHPGDFIANANLIKQIIEQPISGVGLVSWDEAVARLTTIYNSI